MKKLNLLLCTLAFATASSFAQVFPNPGFETWRAGTADGTTVYAPTGWFGIDSLVLANGATFAPFLHFGTPWNGSAQNFQENTLVHSGSSSAKLMTLKQDTLGFFPGILTNAQTSLNTTEAIVLFTSGSGNPEDAVSFSGGTGVTERIQTVRAWVEYVPGIDATTGVHGNDTGLMEVEAISYIGGKDSVVGTGLVRILATGSFFVQVTDTIGYTDLIDAVDTIRVIFASSGGGASRLDSSTLYVDDVTMSAGSEGVKNVTASNDMVQVYPNPASTAIHFAGPQNADLSCKLYSMNGQLMASQSLATQNTVDISTMPAGVYFYTITDANENTVQRGKITVLR